MRTIYLYFTQLCCTCLLLICFALFFVSCKKFVSIPPPENQVVSATVFSTEQTAVAAVTGLYSQLMNGNLLIVNGGMSLYGGLSADELYRTTANSDIDAFTNNALLPGNSINGNLWARTYAYIYHANACIEGLLSSPIRSSVKNQLLGEMKVARAYLYFLLVNLYGDVPLLTSTDYRINAVARRMPVADVYHLITTDLQEAIQLLTPAYPSAGKLRPNVWTARALLARVFIYLEDWVHAEEEASAVISSGAYSLPTVLTDVFLANSPEAIWQLLPVSSSSNTAEGATFIPASASARPTYAFTGSLSAAFEPGDLRKVNWTKTNTVSAVAYTYPFKYKVRSGTVKTEYTIVLRLAEQYLIRAEARARQQRFTESKADLNVVRTRAGLAATTANDEASILLAIEKERRVELFSEWGHRWLDLKRTERADAVLGPVKPGWQSFRQWFPIPLTDLQRNPFLVQNNGY